ncbi:MAG: T9SS type A sorting domain-containing protein [Maribacter sp.]|uniref:T9SS type A sorting domain-containing protein n=1 Tax=Maribacter sp. TaxID=1897614 RepID=UPI003297FDA9
MKKVVRSIAVVALMFVAATGLAKEPKLSVNPSQEKSLNFEMDTTSEETFVRVVDMNGVIIYKEKVETVNSYSKKFNLKNLPEGSYFLEVEDALKETTFEFTVDDSTIRIDKRKENAKPVFRKKEGKVYLNLLNLEKEVVKIKVLDSENRIVFQETIADEMLVEKVFNFEDAFEDNYVVVVQNKKDTYYEDITVK